MFHGRSVAIVVPCRNEQSQLDGVLRSVPAFVDRIWIVDDGSTDRTGEVAEARGQADVRVDPGVVRSRQ